MGIAVVQPNLSGFEMLYRLGSDYLNRQKQKQESEELAKWISGAGQLIGQDPNMVPFQAITQTAPNINTGVISPNSMLTMLSNIGQQAYFDEQTKNKRVVDASRRSGFDLLDTLRQQGVIPAEEYAKMLISPEAGITASPQVIDAKTKEDYMIKGPHSLKESNWVEANAKQTEALSKLIFYRNGGQAGAGAQFDPYDYVMQQVFSDIKNLGGLRPETATLYYLTNNNVGGINRELASNRNPAADMENLFKQMGIEILYPEKKSKDTGRSKNPTRSRFIFENFKSPNSM